MQVNISNHAYKRGKERLGFSKKSLNRMAARVLDNGIQGTELTGSALSWIENKLDNYERTGTIYVYGDKAWVFIEKGNCILLATILNLSNEITRKIKNQIAQ